MWHKEQFDRMSKGEHQELTEPGRETTASTGTFWKLRESVTWNGLQISGCCTASTDGSMHITRAPATMAPAIH